MRTCWSLHVQLLKSAGIAAGSHCMRLVVLHECSRSFWAQQSCSLHRFSALAIHWDDQQPIRLGCRSPCNSSENWLQTYRASDCSAHCLQTIYLTDVALTALWWRRSPDASQVSQCMASIRKMWRQQITQKCYKSYLWEKTFKTCSRFLIA